MNPPCGPEVDTLYTVTVNRRRVEPADVCLNEVNLWRLSEDDLGRESSSEEYNVWCHATVVLFLEKLREHAHHLSHDYYECSLRGATAMGTLSQNDAEYDFEDGLGTLTFGRHVPQEMESASSQYSMSRLVDRHASYEHDAMDLSLSLSCEDSCPPDPFLMRSKNRDRWWRKLGGKKKSSLYSMDVYIKPQSFRQQDFIKFEKRHYPTQARRRAAEKKHIKHLCTAGFMDPDTADRLMEDASS